MTRAQKGTSRRMLEMRRRASEESWAKVVPKPKTGCTMGSFAATRLRRGFTSASSSSRAWAARLPLERAVSASTDMGKNLQSARRESRPTEPHSRRLYRKTPEAEWTDQEERGGFFSTTVQ